MKTCALLCGLLASLWAGGAHAQQQGVTKNEIVMGTILDLSGPLAPYGKSLRDGMMLRLDEANEQGGVHGRRLKLVIEDTGYDPKRAALATQKLVGQDKIFIMVAALGTAPTNAALPVLTQNKIINFFPMTLAREMYEPVDKLKFAFVSSYVEQMNRAVPGL